MEVKTQGFQDRPDTIYLLRKLSFVQTAVVGNGENFLAEWSALLIMICYAIVCYAMLCYVVQCYVMLRYATLCYVTFCEITSWSSFYMKINVIPSQT